MTDETINVDSEEAARERYKARQEERERQQAQQQAEWIPPVTEPGKATLLADYMRPLASLAEGDWLARERWQSRQWLLERRVYQGSVETDRIGYLPAGIVGLFVAPGGTGKTAALVQLALAVATGRDWLGHHIARPGKVLLALGEESADEIARRMHAAARMLDLDEAARQAAYANIVTLPCYGVSAAFLQEDPKTRAYGNTTNYDDLLKTLNVNGPWSLIILDPASRFMGIGDENDNVAATHFIRTLEGLTQVDGQPNVLAAHHTSKGAIFGEHSQASARGASAFVDGARWMASLERLRVRGEADESGRNLVLLRTHKLNYSKHTSDVLFEIMDGGQPRYINPAEYAALLEASEELEVREAARKKARLDAIKADEAERLKRQGSKGGKTEEEVDPYE